MSPLAVLDYGVAEAVAVPDLVEQVAVSVADLVEPVAVLQKASLCHLKLLVIASVLLKPAPY